MRIVIAGGGGQVGTLLARAWQAAGHEVVVLSRKPRAAPWRRRSRLTLATPSRDEVRADEITGGDRPVRSWPRCRARVADARARSGR